MVSSVVIEQSRFNISHLFAHIVCSMSPIDRTFSGVTTPSQSGLGNNGYEGVLNISQISKAGTSSHSNVTYWTLIGSSYPSADMQSVHFTALTDWAEE